VFPQQRRDSAPASSRRSRIWPLTTRPRARRAPRRRWAARDGSSRGGETPRSAARSRWSRAASSTRASGTGSGCATPRPPPAGSARRPGSAPSTSARRRCRRRGPWRRSRRTGSGGRRCGAVGARNGAPGATPMSTRCSGRGIGRKGPPQRGPAGGGRDTCAERDECDPLLAGPRHGAEARRDGSLDPLPGLSRSRRCEARPRVNGLGLNRPGVRARKPTRSAAVGSYGYRTLHSTGATDLRWLGPSPICLRGGRPRTLR